MKSSPFQPEKPKLLDQLRTATQLRHMSPKTTEAYSYWITRFIHFHKIKHPLLMGPPEINEFLTFIAKELRGSGSSQNLALCAILFLYREVLHVKLGDIGQFPRARRPKTDRKPSGTSTFDPHRPAPIP